MTHRPTSGPRAGRVEHARQQEARKVSRRSFMRVSVFAGLTLFVGGMLSAFIAFFNLRDPAGFGAPITVGSGEVPRPGDAPTRIPDARSWLVNLEGRAGDVRGVGGTGGLLALYQVCPHLGCTVPWNPAFDGAEVGHPGIVGWFRCPCHASTYSRAGVLVFGPAPRSMDTFQMDVNPDGSITINTAAIVSGAADPPNPLRAIPYTA